MSNYDIASVTHEIFTILPATVVVIYITLDNATVADTIISDIRSNIALGHDQEIAITGFHPSCTNTVIFNVQYYRSLYIHCTGWCSCTRGLLKNTMNYICIGPSIAPCTWQSNGSYEVSTRTSWQTCTFYLYLLNRGETTFISLVCLGPV